MQSYNLVHLIQYHSDKLAAGLLRNVESSNRAGSYRNISPKDLSDAVHEIYHHLGSWLTHKSEIDIERRYLALGSLRAQQGVPLDEFIWVIILTKQNLQSFIHDLSFAGSPAEMAEKHELLQGIDRFFDHAIYAAVTGYEHAASASLRAEAEAKKPSRKIG